MKKKITCRSCEFRESVPAYRTSSLIFCTARKERHFPLQNLKIKTDDPACPLHPKFKEFTLQ